MKKNKIIQEFEVSEYQGAAALFAGTKCGDLPLKKLKRKGKKVIIIYEK
jgi:hypothetical protein